VLEVGEGKNVKWRGSEKGRGGRGRRSGTKKKERGEGEEKRERRKREDTIGSTSQSLIKCGTKAKKPSR
jgi:hypothetical protein